MNSDDFSTAPPAQDPNLETGEEEQLAKKSGQMSITDFKNVRVYGSESLGQLVNSLNEPISRRKSNRVVIKRKPDSDEEPEHSRKKRPYNRKVVAKPKKGKKATDPASGKDDKTNMSNNEKMANEGETKSASSGKKPSSNKGKNTDSSKAKSKKKENTSDKGSKKDSPRPGNDKENGTGTSSGTSSTASGKVSPKDAIKKSTPAIKPPTQSLADNPILLEDWAPQVPVMSSDFKTQTSILSRFKFPHMKRVPYAKDLNFLMSFINKFHKFLPQDLWALSIQDLEVGLDVYPEPLDSDCEPQSFYADYIPAKDIRRCQDYSNLFYVVLMELCLNRKSLSSLDTLKTSVKPFRLISELRNKAVEFGYPKEWKVQSTLTAERVDLCEKDDIEPVDPQNPEILTPNVSKWTEPLIVPMEEDPLQNQDLERLGLLAIASTDRVVLLRTLAQWCISQSDKIHTEVYRLSHLRKDPTFGIQTYHAPRHLVQGIEATHEHFKKLCKLVKDRMELRSTKKHVKKHLENGTRQDLNVKYALLNELKKNMKEYRQEFLETTDDKKAKFDALTVGVEKDYEKWAKLVYNEIHDSEPLDNPYEDEIYKLRCLEFFIGRVPYVGDFYLPRLYTYQSTKASKRIPTNYCDPITLIKTLKEFENGTITPFELFGRNGKMNSLQFKLYYHDTPAMIHDLMNGSELKHYWYEMCHDSASLQDFIMLLEFKIYKEEDPNKSKKQMPETSETVESTAKNSTSTSDDKNAVGESTVAPPTSSVDDTTPSNKMEPIEGFNCNPLPKEYKYNKSRAKLVILKEYLQKMSHLLRTFEQLKAQYGEMSASDRNLRRSQRTKVSYTEVAPEPSDEEEEELLAEDDDDDEDDEELPVNEDLKPDDVENEYQEEDSENEEEVEEEYQIDSDYEEPPRKRGRPPKKATKNQQKKRKSRK